MQDMYLKDGRNFLYVGDVGRKLVINIPNLDITRVCYETKDGFTKDVEVEYSDEGIYADIPNSFLSGAYSALTCYAIATDGDYEYTASEAHFEIKERQKSEGYSPTEQQLITWDYIERKAVAYMQQTEIYMNHAEQLAIHAGNAADSALQSKNASEQSEANARQSETNAKASETAAKQSETNAKASEEAAKQSEDNAKASETAAKQSLAEAQQIVASKADKTYVDSNLATKADKSELAVERARIDSLSTLPEGSTTGDAELIGIRIGADGVTYPNAGEAVRAQILNEKTSRETAVNELKGDLVDIEDALLSQHIINREPTVEYYGNYTIGAGGVVTKYEANDAYIIKTNGVKNIIVDNANIIGFFSEMPEPNVNYSIDNARHFDYSGQTIQVPDNCNYIFITNAKGISVSARNKDASVLIYETISEIEGEKYNDAFNVLPTDSGSAMVNGVACKYTNGILSIKGTATAGGGRTNVIKTFTIPAGTYSHRGLDTHNKNYAVFIEDRITNEIIYDLQNTFTVTFDSDREVYLGVNVEKDAVYDVSLQLQLTKGEKPLDDWYIPSGVSGKDEVCRNTAILARKSNYNMYTYAIGNILVIGDSLSAGGTWTQEWGETTESGIKQSWPYYMGRMLNANVTNSSVSGYSASDWFEKKSNNYDYKNFDTFIIWLGTNNGLTDTLETDVFPYTDYNNFAETETGFYCKIIEKIKAEHGHTSSFDDCLIVLSKVFASKGDIGVTNVVIDKIANKYGLPVVDNSDFNDFKFPEFRNNGIKNVHYGKAGGIYIANRFISALGEWFADDLSRCEFGWEPK